MTRTPSLRRLWSIYKRLAEPDGTHTKRDLLVARAAFYAGARGPAPSLRAPCRSRRIRRAALDHQAPETADRENADSTPARKATLNLRLCAARSARKQLILSLRSEP